MAQNIFNRLKDYYTNVAKVLRGEAEVASIFPNTTDIGMAREKIYAEFLRKHAPSKCNVFFGGFVFDEDGAESKQLDIIITTDTAPCFNFYNTDGSEKSFSPVEGTLGVVSVKSNLNKAELLDALNNIASIPPTRSLTGRVNPMLKVKNYDDWPQKVIYASNGIAPEILLSHIKEFYNKNEHIPLNRRPQLIHVAGSCLIVRAVPGMALTGAVDGSTETLTVGNYYVMTLNPDLQAIAWVLNELQSNATASTHIIFRYDHLINKVCTV